MSDNGDAKKKDIKNRLSVADRAKEKMEVGEPAWIQSEIFDSSTETRNRQAEKTTKPEEYEEVRLKEEWDWEKHSHTEKVTEKKMSNRLKYWVVIALASLAASALIFLHSQFFSNG